MTNRILTGLVMLLFFNACSFNDKEGLQELNSGSVQLAVDYLQPVQVDSFSIDENSRVLLDRVPKLDREQYLSNRIFLLTRSGVKVGLMDTTGHFMRQITQKGDGPGEIIIATSAKGWQSKQGEIYVLTNANAYSLHVYDRNGNFRYVLRLFDVLGEGFHPWGSSFHISEKEEGVYKVTMSIGSTTYDPIRKGFYEVTSSIARFVIDDAEERVISVDTFLPYKDLPKVKAALETETVCWSGNDARFQIVGDLIYLTYPFSEEVYLLNKDFEVQKTFRLKTLNQYETGYCLPMTDKLPETTYERTYNQYHTYLGNAHITNLQVLDNLLILQYVAPLPENEYLPKFPDKGQAQDIFAYSGFFQKRDKYWLIYNMDNGNEQLIKLSPYHQQGIFLDKQRMLVEKTYEDMDERYLMKYRLAKPIGE